MLRTKDGGSRRVNTCLEPWQVPSYPPRRVSSTTRPKRVKTRLDSDRATRHERGRRGRGHGAQTTKQGFVVCALGASFFFLDLFFFTYLLIFLVSVRLNGPRQPRSQPHTLPRSKRESEGVISLPLPPTPP